MRHLAFDVARGVLLAARDLVGPLIGIGLAVWFTNWFTAGP